MAKIDNVQEVAVSELIPYVNNAKIHSEDQVTKIAASIREFGFLNPVLIDEQKNIIAGHGRVMAAKKLGLEVVPCINIEGLSDAQRKAYILADNKLGELADWDKELVSEELKFLKEFDFDIGLTGFGTDDIILDDDGVFEIPEEPEVKTEEVKQRTKFGDVWKLGKHRLMVGDSTDYGNVQTLMDGNLADCLITDPPYNVAISNATGDTIANDDMEDSDFYQFLYDAFMNAQLSLKEGGSFYIWHADSEGKNFRNAAEAAGLKIRQNLVWVKNSFTLGRQDYQWQHEPCLYGWKEGAGHYFVPVRNFSTCFESKTDLYEKSKDELVDMIYEVLGSGTVIHEDKPRVDSLHPTMKPQALIRRQMKNSTKEGDTVLDLFGGSGTTLLVAEQIGRTCYMMEYDPKYADVIIQLWEEQTGRKAELLK